MIYHVDVECLYCGKRSRHSRYDHYMGQQVSCSTCGETKLLKVTEVDASKGDVFGYKQQAKVAEKKEQAKNTKVDKRSDDYDPFG